MEFELGLAYSLRFRDAAYCHEWGYSGTTPLFPFASASHFRQVLLDRYNSALERLLVMTICAKAFCV